MIPPAVTLTVRRLRPLTINIGLVIYLCHRLSNPNGISLLNTLAAYWAWLEDEVFSQIVDGSFFLHGDNNTVQVYLQTTLLKVMQIISTIAQDVIAISGIFGLLRISHYCLYQINPPELKEILSRQIFHWVMHSNPLPMANAKIQEISDKILKEADSMLGKDPNRIIRTSLPKVGLSDDLILKELSSCAMKENAKCESGKISGTLYSGGRQHSELMSKVYSLYQWSNPLKPGVWPRVNQCEAEIIAMTSKILHGPSIGCVTSGGTESIFTAIRAHLVCYGKQRGILCPEIICGSTAHCSLNKACDILGIRLVTLDCDDGYSYELKADMVRKYITCNTIMIFASAPAFPHGTIDPIADLSSLAMQYDVGLHVDACLGGFVLPFCNHMLPQVFDFRLPGVTSMSADTHKYGHATKGTSVVVFRSLELQHASYFPYSNWSGGLYITPTVAGSRPGSLIGCAWAALVSIGEAGYKQRAQFIVEGARRIADEIKTIPGLKLMTPNPTIVVAFSSDEFNIYRVKDALSKMGWSLNPLQSPRALNICVTENIAVDEFLRDLRAAVARVIAECQTQKRGTAKIYDAVRTLPSSVAEYAMCRFTDACLSP